MKQAWTHVNHLSHLKEDIENLAPCPLLNTDLFEVGEHSNPVTKGHIDSQQRLVQAQGVLVLTLKFEIPKVTYIRHQKNQKELKEIFFESDVMWLFLKTLKYLKTKYVYCTNAIIHPGLYIF